MKHPSRWKQRFVWEVLPQWTASGNGARALEVGGWAARKRGRRRKLGGLVGSGVGRWGVAAGWGATTGVVAPLSRVARISR